MYRKNTVKDAYPSDPRGWSPKARDMDQSLYGPGPSFPRQGDLYGLRRIR